MNFTAVNFLAILVAAIAHMVLGFLWYGPLFSKPWMAARGMKAEDMQNQSFNPVGYLVPFVGALVSAYVLSLFITATGQTMAGGGLLVGLLAGLGLLVPAYAATYLFSGKSMTLYLIDVGYSVVSLAIMGLILGAWR